jgi:predicted CoA-substrate-specific enzyme activase
LLKGDRPIYFAGLDVGASATKAVVIDDKADVLGAGVLKTGMQYERAAEDCLTQAIAAAGLRAEDISHTVSTGYGRKNISLSDCDFTEITCLAKGAFHYFPRSSCVVDIGGQDNKMIRLNGDGRRTDFQLNRKCAAGTGAFLEEIAHRLDLRLDELEPLARKSTRRVELGSYCTVFTFSEILSHLQKNVSLEDLVRGAILSVVKRIFEFGIQGSDVVLSGGVVEHTPLIAEMLGEEYRINVLLPPRPQLTCAVGAALISRDRFSAA